MINWTCWNFHYYLFTEHNRAVAQKYKKNTDKQKSSTLLWVRRPRAMQFKTSAINTSIVNE